MIGDVKEINADNNKYYLEQLKFAVDSAKSEFSAALDTLGMYNKIENEELAAKVSEEVITANNTISGILADLRKLYADAEKEMNNLDGGVLFDPDKKYLAEAQAKRETIKKALETLDANVRPEVDALFNSTYNNAKKALDNAVAELEKAGKLTAVVTQNIDGLHQKAGSHKVYELHGSVHRNYCVKCHKFFDAEYVAAADGVPHCDACGGVIKPDVVLYEESLDGNVMQGAINAIAGADMLIIGGTSLVVYPAAGMIDYFRGKYLVVLNRDATSRDKQADLCITDPIGEVLGQIKVNK